MKVFSRGQRSKLSDITSSTSIEVGVGIGAASGLTVDVSCFGLDAEGRLSDDRYFVFYNQRESPEGALALLGPQGPGEETFEVDLNGLPPTVRRLVFAVTVDGPGSVARLGESHLRLVSGGREVARYPFEGTDFGGERAIMIGELYFKDVWRFAAVGQGFEGGLSALLGHFGGEEEDPAPVAPVPRASSSREERTEVKLRKEAPQLVDLSKQLSVSLKKNGLEEVVARVVLVLDASGSMSRQYERGNVQAVVDRIATLAMRFDNDGELDVWAFASRHSKLASITTRNVNGYVEQASKGSGLLSIIGKLGVGNNEPPVMREVMAHATGTPGARTMPTFVVFISDGGIYKDAQIEEIMVDASRLSVFWQFVGLGGSKYGVLERLDTMSGRTVDNAGFFHVDDLAGISDDVLYDRLLSEFPKWLREAKEKGVVS